MGFTRYWYIDENLKEFPSGALKDIKAIFSKYSSLIREETDSSNPPILRKDMIRFNGIGDEGYETFLIQLPMTRTSFIQRDDKNPKLIFGFCKTARMPYDIVVKSVLIVLKKHLKNKIVVHSDE